MGEGEDTTTQVSPGLRPAAPPSEAAVREALARDDARRGTETTVALYGAEVFGFVSAVVDDPVAARDVYLRFAERLRRHLALFRWHCSLRTWCYALARRETAHQRDRAAGPRPSVSPSSVPPSSVPPSSPGIARAGVDSLGAWTTGGPTLRGGIDILRAELAPEDREILVLRVDRSFSWRDVAFTSLDDASEGDIQREAERLAVRFAAIKDALARAAVAHGITPRPEQSDGNLERRYEGITKSRAPARSR
jgi:RNA polymerase sigma-70 factor (ECF subfamily)